MKACLLKKPATGRALFLVSLIAALALVSGCKSKDSTEVRPPTRDGGITNPDMYAEPAIAVEVDTPAYMSAGSTYSDVKIKVWGVRKSPKEVLEAARAVFSLHKPSGEIVEGAMDWAPPAPSTNAFWSWSANARWTPTKPLADGDYVAVLDETKAEVMLGADARRRHFFHIGSITRVRRVRISRDGAETYLAINFTALLNPTQALAKLSAAVDQDAPFSFSAVGRSLPAENASVVVKLPPEVALDKDLTLTLGTDVGAVSAGLLDGLYTGVPGSGPFELTIPKNSVSLGSVYEWWASIPVSF